MKVGDITFGDKTEGDKVGRDKIEQAVGDGVRCQPRRRSKRSLHGGGATPHGSTLDPDAQRRMRRDFDNFRDEITAPLSLALRSCRRTERV